MKKSKLVCDTFFRKNRFDEIILTNYSYFTLSRASFILNFIISRIIWKRMEGLSGAMKREKKKDKDIFAFGRPGYFSPSDESDDYLVYYGAERSLNSPLSVYFALAARYFAGSPFR